MFNPLNEKSVVAWASRPSRRSGHDGLFGGITAPRARRLCYVANAFKESYEMPEPDAKRQPHLEAYCPKLNGMGTSALSKNVL